MAKRRTGAAAPTSKRPKKSKLQPFTRDITTMAVDDQAFQNSESRRALTQSQDLLHDMIITTDADVPFDDRWPDYNSADEEAHANDSARPVYNKGLIANWNMPPKFCDLSDCDKYMVIKNVPVRERREAWPATFDKSGNVRPSSPPYDPAMIIWAHGQPFFPVDRLGRVYCGAAAAEHNGFMLATDKASLGTHMFHIGEVIAHASYVNPTFTRQLVTWEGLYEQPVGEETSSTANKRIPATDTFVDKKNGGAVLFTPTGPRPGRLCSLLNFHPTCAKTPKASKINRRGAPMQYDFDTANRNNYCNVTNPSFAKTTMDDDNPREDDDDPTRDDPSLPAGLRFTRAQSAPKTSINIPSLALADYNTNVDEGDLVVLARHMPALRTWLDTLKTESAIARRLTAVSHFMSRDEIKEMQDIMKDLATSTERLDKLFTDKENFQQLTQDLMQQVFRQYLPADILHIYREHLELEEIKAANKDFKPNEDDPSTDTSKLKGPPRNSGDIEPEDGPSTETSNLKGPPGNINPVEISDITSNSSGNSSDNELGLAPKGKSTAISRGAQIDSSDNSSHGNPPSPVKPTSLTPFDITTSYAEDIMPPSSARPRSTVPETSPETLQAEDHPESDDVPSSPSVAPNA